MTPLETYLRQRLQRKKLLLMTHVVVGYPSLDANMAMLEAMQRAEVDVVEFQLPFSEPIADGPVFVRANQHALAAGMNWERYFKFMQRATTAFDFKILMMGYYNSVLQMGHDTFCACLAEHGGSGFIVADLPPEEAERPAPARRCPPPITHCPHDAHQLAGAPARDCALCQRLCVLCRAQGRDREADVISMTVWKPLWRAVAGPRPCLWPWASASAPVLTCGVCTAWQTWGFSARPYSRPGNRAEPRSMRQLLQDLHAATVA